MIYLHVHYMNMLEANMNTTFYPHRLLRNFTEVVNKQRYSMIKPAVPKH